MTESPTDCAHTFAILRRRVGRCFTCAAMRHVHVLGEANGYHPSIQSTLTRPHQQQLADWRALSALISSLSP